MPASIANAGKPPRSRRALGLVPRIMLMSVSGILVLGVCITGVAKVLLERGATKAATERVETNMRVAWDVLRANGSPFKIENGKLLAGTTVLNGDIDVVDKIKTLVGGTATIFLKDTRIATNVQKPDGARATGTLLARSPAYDAIFERKTPFRGEVTILGEPYMTAYDPILSAGGDVLGILYVGIKKVDFLETANETFWTIIYATLGVVLAAIVANYVVARRSVARPLNAAIAAMRRLAQGDLTVDTPVHRRRDEIGEIMSALAVFKDNGMEVERLKTEQSAVEQRAAAARQREMVKLADGFEGAVGQIVETVSSASKELETSATTLSSISERSQSLAVAVAASSEEASTNVQSVASATEQMSSSVNEISRRVQDSARIANNAVEQAGETNRRVGELAAAASRIGDVVELINSIAGQTNLLALNATIEAARAGDAGRGFAVVAAEVKLLAEQTAKATSEISQQIDGIQAATKDSVVAIREIGSTIGQMSEIASAIAAAVEQQGATTHEISRNVQQAAAGTLQVSTNIADVQHGVQESGSAAAQVLSAAQSLSGESTRLKLEVGKFLQSVRTA